VRHNCRRIDIGCEVCSDGNQNLNYAYQNITRNTFEFWKIVSTFSVKAGTKKKTNNRAEEITLVEENNGHYDCESDVGELHMPAT
jgi:hypothetical protein